MQDQSTTKKDTKFTNSSHKKHQLSSGLATAHLEKGGQGMTLSQVLSLQNGSPSCSSISPKRQAAIKYHEVISPKQLFKATISSEKQALNNMKSQPSFDIVPKGLIDMTGGDRATLGSTGPSVSIGNQPGGRSTATFQSNANSNSRLTTNQTESIDQSLSARRFLKILPSSQSQQLKLIQPFHSTTTNHKGTVFSNEKSASPLGTAKSPTNGKALVGNKKPSHLNETISSSRRATQNQLDQQIHRVQSATPNGRKSTRMESLDDNVVESMMKRAYKRQAGKSGSSIKPILADDTPRILGEPLPSNKLPEGQQSKEKPQVDVEGEEDEAAEEYMLIPTDRNETADEGQSGFIAQGSPKTKLVHAAHIQQQRLFSQQIEDNSFGVQQHPGEGIIGLVEDSRESSLDFQDRQVSSSNQMIGVQNQQILFHRHLRRFSTEEQYGSEYQDNDKATESTPSDYIEVDASEFPYADPAVVNEAIESMSENSYYEEGQSYVDDQTGIANQNDYEDNQKYAKHSGRQFYGNSKHKRAIDESTPDKYATHSQLPVSDHKIIESSRSCKPVASGPLPSAFTITADKPTTASGCQTPFEKQNTSPVQRYIHQTMVSPKKKSADKIAKKPKHFKLHQMPSLDLTHQALSPRKGSISQVLQEQLLTKGTPQQRVLGQYQVKNGQSNQARNKAVSIQNKSSKTPQGAAFKSTYSNYLNEQTSVLAQKREQEREARERGLIQGADALRQKSTSATAKYERGSRNPLGQTKKHQDVNSFMSSKPSQKVMASQAIFQTTCHKGNETPSILAGSPNNPKLDRQKTLTGSQSGVKSKKKDRRKQSFSNNTINLQAQVIQQTVESCSLQPFQKQKTDNQKTKVNKALIQELKVVNSVRNHPAGQSGQTVQKIKHRPQAIDPSMTQPLSILGQQNMDQLDTAFQTTNIEHRRGSSKVKMGQSKVIKVKKNSFNSNQLTMTGLAQKVSAVATANLRNDHSKPSEKPVPDFTKKEIGTAQKQRSKHFKTDAKGQDMSQQKVSRINSQAVQISKFGKQSSLACQVDGPTLTEPSSTQVSVTNQMTQNIELRSLTNQQFKQDKKLTKEPMNKNSVLGARNQNIKAKSSLVDQQSTSKPGSVLAKSFKPIKLTQQRQTGPAQERSSSVMKIPRNIAKTEQTENSIIGTSTEKSKKTSSFTMNQKLMTPRGNQAEAGANLRSQQEKKARQDWGLLESEKAQYGDRCPKNYEKLRLLGKGGCAIVWLAKDLSDNKHVALKQFPKPKGKGQDGAAFLDPTAKNEIEIGKKLFTSNKKYDGYSVDPNQYPGIRKIAKLYDVLDEPKDVWLVYEVGAKPLSDHLFEVKGEFYKGERIYGVQHQDFYRALRQDKKVIKGLIRQLSQVFDVLAMFRVVHADIKPDNILIDFDGRQVKDIKLIDFGSAFSYETPSNISASTPEYLAPEVLEYLENRGANTSANGMNSTNLCNMQEPWSYDMWSLGTILLELLTGIPIWLSLKCRAQTQTGKSLIGMGIFGVQGRQGKKILQKQQQSLKNLSQTLKKYDCYGLDKDANFMDLLCRMLDPNPVTRISPVEVLEHPFVQEKE